MTGAVNGRDQCRAGSLRPPHNGTRRGSRTGHENDSLEEGSCKKRKKEVTTTCSLKKGSNAYVSRLCDIGGRLKKDCDIEHRWRVVDVNGINVILGQYFFLFLGQSV